MSFVASSDAVVLSGGLTSHDSVQWWTVLLIFAFFYFAGYVTLIHTLFLASAELASQFLLNSEKFSPVF